MKKFKPMKVKDSSIRLPDEFLDHFLINEGDYIALIEEDGKFYLRKTREIPKNESDDFQDVKSEEGQIPPKTFDEIMREAQKQFAGGDVLPEDIMKSLQDTLKDPEMMKKIQDMAMGFFKGFSVPPSPDDTNQNSTSPKKEEKKKTKDTKDDDDEEDTEGGFKIDIE